MTATSAVSCALLNLQHELMKQLNEEAHLFLNLTSGMMADSSLSLTIAGCCFALLKTCVLHSCVQVQRPAELAMNRSASALLTQSSQIDPSFCCRGCNAKPYADDRFEILTTDPSTIKRPLAWVNHRWCLNCDETITVAYRYDLAVGGKYHEFASRIGGLIKHIQEDPDSQEEFLERKAHMNKALLCIPCLSKQGVHASYSSQTGMQVVSSEFEFWPMATYRVVYGEPSSNNLCHTKINFKGQEGMGVFARPPGVLLVRPFENSLATRETCLASTVNGQELCKDDIKLAYEKSSDSFIRTLSLLCWVGCSKSWRMNLGCVCVLGSRQP